MFVNICKLSYTCDVNFIKNKVHKMSNTLTVANWKMNGNRKLWRELTQKVSAGMTDIDTQVVLATPSAAFADVSALLGEYSKVSLAAQDIHPQTSGAHTGDTSAEMLKDFGGQYTLVGHSERRLEHHEKGALLNEKLKKTLHEGLQPIFCFGESLTDKNAGATLDVLAEQLDEGLHGVVLNSGEELVLAYEPVWAISSSAGSLGREPSEKELIEVFQFVHEKVAERFGLKQAENIKLLYGGSVKPDNVAKIISNRYIAGVLVGGASLKAETFLEIARGVASKPTIV
jgi:triosephosphate isomerase